MSWKQVKNIGKKEEDLFRRAMELYSEKSQGFVLIEECGELIQVVSKCLNNRTDRIEGGATGV